MASPSRPLRADAARNRTRLIAIAREALMAGQSTIGLDEIARRAGVGIGTLYRHFANRQELLEALYRDEVSGLLNLEKELASSQPPHEALRAWLIAFVDVLIAKRVIGPALAAIVGPEAQLPISGDTIKGAVTRLASNAMATGTFDPSVDPVDLLRAIAGTIEIAPDDRVAERARRMVDILLAGVQPA